ncbi:phosphopantetheine-binding protein [Aeromonas hydrophila]|uniref:phosphopantetheine-binding protein n=1 Tax=Aeromonas hydrophila TaxID=644 RepID=UPI0020A124ED|nr:phosphopantetheine-binding protein [Aeromonas hydrophila]MCP1266559.1 phosphopantetheine-binding protein [Aeromonas hydrophila]MCP1295373.1 phosphopantetheine-binding protein [Aeromonas hydrophila]
MSRPTFMTREWLNERVQSLVEEGELDPEESLVLYGLDSLSIMRFTAELKAQGVNVGFDELVRRPTLSAWWALLSSSPAA